ncbi:MAG: response regulator transcription factor [Paracoccaceae bacterium]
MARILIVEDDADIASVLSRGLGAAGHAVAWAESADAARAAGDGFDAAIIDMMLGGDSGAALLAGLRAQGQRMPAIMLSALSRVEDRAEGLEAGAQDYVVKPFQLSELLARLEVQLRRATPRVAPAQLGRLVYDPAARSVTGADRPVVLTEREGDLLAFLIARQGEVLTRGELFDTLWAPHGGSTENVVDVYLGYLRRKLGNFTPYGLSLRTMRGRGFVLAVEEGE